MSKQIKVEEEMCSRGYDSRQRKVQLNIQKGKESENDYARSMIAAGLGPYSKQYSSLLIGLGGVHQGRRLLLL